MSQSFTLCGRKINATQRQHYPSRYLLRDAPVYCVRLGNGLELGLSLSQGWLPLERALPLFTNTASKYLMFFCVGLQWKLSFDYL